LETRAVRTVTFTCNLCGSANRIEVERGHGYPNCSQCRSIARWRAVVYALSVALFGEGLFLSDFPHRPDLTGIGLSDDRRYAEGLAAKLTYRNTFFDHDTPRLDITRPPDDLRGTLDFLIASEVFEHVAPPVERAFAGAFELLKPGGVMILTVPSRHGGETEEHFPDLHEYRVVELNGRRALENVTVDGRRQRFENLHFHGGGGLTLEMRVFSHPSLLGQLRDAGFDPIIEWRGSHPEIGVPWAKPTNMPVTAHRPQSTA
jgi:SAM-dependent methyltransferase